jgi:hypothetical protein
MSDAPEARIMRGESPADAVARAAAMIERDDAAARAAQTPPRPARAAGVIALAVLAGLNLGAWLLYPPRAADPLLGKSQEAVARDARTVVNGLAADIHAWRVANDGRVPLTLDEASLHDNGVAYDRLGDTDFVLRLTIGVVEAFYESRTRPPSASPATGELR